MMMVIYVGPIYVVDGKDTLLNSTPNILQKYIEELFIWDGRKHSWQQQHQDQQNRLWTMNI